MNMKAGYRGGPYSFRDSLVMARVEDIAGTDVTIKVKSVYWPVVMTVDGEDITATFPDDTPVVVDFESAGTFSCSFTEAAGVGPANSGDDLEIVVPE